MNLSNIQAGATIIAPAYLHYDVQKALLKNRKGLGNVHVCTLETWQQLPNDDHTIYTYYNCIKQMPFLNYHKKTAATYSFIKETMTFIMHLKQFHLDPNQFPADNPLMEELKQIIIELHKINLPIDHATIDPSNLQELYIIDEYSDFYHEQIYQMLETKGAKRIHFNHCLESKEYYYALNKREEIESLAQYITTHQIKAEECKISLLDTTYQPFIESIFNRYQIPYSFIFKHTHHLLQTQFSALLNYALHPNHENALELLLTQIINHTNLEDCITYMRLYELDFHDDFTIIQNLHISNDIIDAYEIKYLMQLETHAQSIKEILLDPLDKLIHAKNFITLLEYADAFLLEHYAFHTKEDHQSLLQIRKVIQHAYTHHMHAEDLPFLNAILNTQTISSKQIIKGVRISDFRHPLPTCNYHFVLGCTQENYPAFQALNGIYEESIHTSMGYPSLEERYHLHTKQYKNYLYTATHLVCFYCVSTFDGKTLETSLELDTFMGKATAYPLIDSYIPYRRQYQISPQEAKKLYLKDGELHGSISSLERYANCPYAYFLRYGLSLKEPNDPSFNIAKAGTLSHYLMEVLVSKYGKQYGDTKESELASLIASKVEELQQIYPNQSAFLTMLSKRLCASMKVNLEVLQNMEKHSSLNTFICEQDFSHSFKFEDGITLHLHGIIDRIDMNQDFFRIIDYKSSEKSLKEEQVFAALQLQLITYLVICEKQLGKRPLGAFYFSFNQSTIPMIHTKLSKRPLEFKEISNDGALLQTKEKRLNGWICSEYIEVMDDDGSHIKGVRNSKASGINTSTIYKSSTLHDYIEMMYHHIASNILSGNIACESAENACTYCPYQAVCGNANHPKKKDELIEVHKELYQKGGRKHA